MRTGAIACATCGADQGNVPPLYCRSCGARRAGGADPGFRTDAERYELVTKEPAYARAMKHAPRLGWGDVARHVVMLIVAAAIATGGLAFVSYAEAGTLFEVAFGGIGALVMLLGLYEIGVAIARILAPTRRRVAVLLSDDVKHPTQTPQARLRYGDGEEQTVVVDQRLMSLLVVGDIGVAYLQRDRLVDYRWFDVMPPEDAPGGGHVAPSCPGCAAPITFDSREACSFCRAPLPEPNLGEHAAALHDARGAAAKVPQTPARDPRPSPVAPILVVGIAGYATYATLRFQLAAITAGERWPWLWAVVGVLGCLTLAGAVWLWRRVGPRAAPIRALTHVLRRRRWVYATVNRRPVYRHAVTLVAENGAREELRTTEVQWKALDPDETAVVWERDGTLVDAVVVARASRPPAR
ncbi:MAG TPA: hypothetical protein VM261_29875 [Kofleriaceae bacterium]|nr:hypothetical protein [Kofleriaceae bacterium]